MEKCFTFNRHLFHARRLTAGRVAYTAVRLVTLDCTHEICGVVAPPEFRAVGNLSKNCILVGKLKPRNATFDVELPPPNFEKI